METITKQKTLSEMIRTEPVVLVDFFTEWCVPCNMMKPILEELKSSVGTKASILKIDAEKNIWVASKYPFLLFRKGKEVWRQSGLIPPGHFRQIIDQNGKG